MGIFLILATTNAGLDTGEGRAASEYAGWLVEKRSLGLPAPLGPLYVRGGDGRYYPAHELGNAAAIAPAAAATAHLAASVGVAGDRAGELSRFAVTFLPGLYIAGTAAALWYALVAALGRSSDMATRAALILVFTTYLWAYSRTLFDGVLAGALLAWATAWSLAAGTRGSNSLFVLAGAALGAAIATRSTCVLLVPAFLWHAVKAGRTGSLPCFVAGMAPFALWQAYYNTLRTGSPVVPAIALPVFAINNGFAAPWIGAAGVLLSPGKAIWLYAPTVALALMGFRRFWCEQRRAAFLVLLAAGPFLLLHVSIRNWSGDWGWGPRYLVTILPLLYLAIPYAFDRSGAVRRRLATGLVAAGIALQVPALIINWEYRYIYVRQQTGRTPDAWSLTQSQFADAVGASIRNVRRAAGADVPLEVVAGAHPVNVQASNHVNFWWLTAVHAGAPATVCLALAAGMLFGGVALLVPFLRDRDDERPIHDPRDP